MAKKTKEQTIYKRVDNAQKFSTFRLVPAINQKNYFTTYLKKDSQYLCRKLRERSDAGSQDACIFHLGSENLRVGISSQTEPVTLPFNVAKLTTDFKRSSRRDHLRDHQKESLNFSDEEKQALAEAEQSFIDRMKFYKTRVIHNAKDTCRDFNARQKGERTSDSSSNLKEIEGVTGGAYSGTTLKYFCMPTNAKLKPNYSLYWPLRRGKLNEDPKFYKSPQELEADIHDILYYATYSERGINLPLPTKNKKVKLENDSNKQEEKDETSLPYEDAILVIPDLFDKTSLSIFVSTLYKIGFKYVAIIQESVAATYGAGITAGCVVDIGAQTTTVACVEDGLCIADSRVHLDFGSGDITNVFAKLLNRISFPGDPDNYTLNLLKEKYLTVNEADISVQLYRYYTRNLKFDFKVYNEVMLPVLALFYPHLFGQQVTGPQFINRFKLYQQQLDPYTGHVANVLSDADINVRMQTLAVLNMSYKNETVSKTAKNEDDEVEQQHIDEDDEESRLTTPDPSASGTAATEQLSQIGAYESLDLTKPAYAPLDHAIIESITQAEKHSGNPKLYYENILVVGGGSKVPSFYTMLSDRLAMWNQSRLKEIGDVAVMAIPQGTDAESICWRGGCVYSKLKIVDEMWTSSDEWDVLGSRTLHYKAALYSY